MKIKKATVEISMKKWVDMRFQAATRVLFYQTQL